MEGALKTAYFVYGNHGKAPPQLDDYYAYLGEAFEAQGFRLHLSEYPVKGNLNILLECFDSAYCSRIREAAAAPGTRLILIATEFITGSTFNDFSGEAQKLVKRKTPAWLKFIVKNVAPFLFPKFVRGLAIERFPEPYFNLRQKYYSILGIRNDYEAAFRAIFQARFDCFIDVIDQFESVWCVTPHQLKEYIALLGSLKVKCMPLTSWSPAVKNRAQSVMTKDIDFLFTGSITPYRSYVLETLKARGYNVVVGPASWPGYMRDHFISRSKVCLQIRQDPQWKYPSVMRYHYLLTAGSVVVAEEATERCVQENFLYLAPPKDFIETCELAIVKGDFVAHGRRVCERYFEGTEGERQKFVSLLPDFSNGHIREALPTDQFVTS